MFFELDTIVFPTRCEVIEIVPSQHYVYPIFKNGSTSLRITQKITKWRSVCNKEIEQIQAPITVYLRNPKKRFVSGINTFVQHCLRDCPELDINTILYFVKKYLFLNRHYAPQFYWLINLARYSTAPLLFQKLDDINKIVDIDSHARVTPPSDNFLETVESFPWEQLELYFFLDQLLIDRIGQIVTFGQLMNDIRNDHSELYQLLFKKNIELVNVLSKT